MRSGEKGIPWSLLEFLGRRVLEGAEAALRRKGVKIVSSAVEDGDPVRRILESAKAAKADCIVMGSRGLGDLKGMVFGSVSHKVAHLAPCTCITVK